MSALAAQTVRIELGRTTAGIWQLKARLAGELPRLGFTAVTHTQAEVAGNRGGVHLSVLHLPIGSRTFWQVVMASGDTFDSARIAVEDAARVLNGIVYC